MCGTTVRARPRLMLASGAIVLIIASRIGLAQSIAAGESIALPATGQNERHTADRADGEAGPLPIPDDGHVRAGAPLRYRDNRDGTITDLNTHLMWEKKCSGRDGLHDARKQYRWSADGEAETIWDWVRQVNVEGDEGFAGYSDWRIPNVNELVSILDYGQRLPAVSAAFQGELCALECVDLTRPGCSCTEIGEYWSSTTFADFPAHALAVFFGMGLVNDRVKTNLGYVRAVRGGQ